MWTLSIVAVSLASRLVNGVLSVKPLADLARARARDMMIKRAESIGVAWRKEVAKLAERDWSTDLAAVEDRALVYPEYYLKPFHAYDRGNLCWDAALEVEVAAYAVHARIWPEAGAEGDGRLRRAFLDVLIPALGGAPRDVLDLGCSVGMSTAALAEAFPTARLVGVDLSPYFLSVARTCKRTLRAEWLHAPAEATGLPEASFDLVTAFLVFHELPAEAARAVLAEARRLVRPGGTLALMDMNPRSEVYARMPAYILTLLKSTEPYLDEYFGLDLEGEIQRVGFTAPRIVPISPRHRTVIARG